MMVRTRMMMMIFFFLIRLTLHFSRTNNLTKAHNKDQSLQSDHKPEHHNMPALSP